MTLGALFCIWMIQSPTIEAQDELQRLGEHILGIEDELEAHSLTKIEANSRSPNAAGEQLALKLVELAERRVSIMTDRGMAPKEIAKERLRSARSLMDAYCFNPKKQKYLNDAQRQILQAETANTNPEDYLGTLLHESYIRLKGLQELQPEPEPEPEPKESPTPKVKPSSKSVEQAPPTLPRPEGRLSFRLEGGYGLWRDNFDPEGGFLHSGYLTAAVHGRVPFKNLTILVGPYLAWSRAHKDKDDHAAAIDSGGRIELEVYLSDSSRRVVTLHPYLEAGLGTARPTYNVEDSRRVGVALGPGLALCFVDSVICPNFRIKLLPTPAGSAIFDTSLQFGVAISPRRFLKGRR